MRIKINSKGLTSEVYYKKYFYSSASNIIKNYFEVNRIEVELSKLENKYSAFIKTSFLELPIMAQESGSNLNTLCSLIFENLKHQLNQCRDLLVQ